MIDLPFEELVPFFVRANTLTSVLSGVIKFLQDREWRGACASVVGEYGSGKSQLGVALLRMIKRAGVRAFRVVLGPTSDVREEILSRVEEAGPGEPVVLVVDEIDQLVEDVVRRRDRSRLEELTTLVRGLTEAGEGRPPRASFVLLLSKRAREELERDRALSNRLGRRLREFRISMPDDERVEAARDATVRVMALFAASDLERRRILNSRFSVIYSILSKKAADKALSREIGSVVKYVTDTLEDVLDHFDPERELPSGTEFGRRAEEVWRSYMVKRLGAIRFTVVSGGVRRDYMATLDTARLRSGGRLSDAQYLIWPFDPERGERGRSLVQRVGVEVKVGRSWVDGPGWSQVRGMLGEHPVLLFSVEEWNRSELESVEAQLSDGVPHPARVVEVDPDLIGLALLLREDYAWEFIDRHGAFQRDLQEIFPLLVGPAAWARSPPGPAGGDAEAALIGAVGLLVDELGRGAEKSRYKRLETLARKFRAHLRAAFGERGLEPPEVTVEDLRAALRVLEGEGLGSLRPKSFKFDAEARGAWARLREDPGLRGRVVRAAATALGGLLPRG